MNVTKYSYELYYVIICNVNNCFLLAYFQHDFHYEYTECDSEGGRWRVSVPKPNVCVGGAPNPPVRGKGCGK